MADVYEMPAVQLGDWVYYYAHEGAEPATALVQKVGRGTVVLWVVSPGYGGVEKPSVHHKNDPRMADYPEWKSYGTWDYQPSKLAILSEKVALLEKKVAELEQRRAK